MYKCDKRSGPKEDLVGRRFGSLTVASYAGRKDGKTYWSVVCDCGNSKDVRSDQMKIAVSCGCLTNNMERRRRIREAGYRSVFGLPRHLESKIIPVTESGCWLWDGCIGGDRPWVNVGGRQKIAYRVVYELLRGKIPRGLFLLHSCDIGICVNPDHVRVGTQAENMRDASDRGRIQHGEQHYSAKLTDSKVREILSGVDSYTVTANRYGVSRNVIRDIRAGKTWKHVARGN